MSDDVTESDPSALADKKLSVVTHAENFLRRFSNKDDPVKISKAVGNDTIANQLSSMLESQLLPQFFLQAIERFGAPKVDTVVRKISHQMKTSKISNLGAYFNKAIQEEGFSEKTSPRTQNRPSWASQTPIGKPNSPDRQNSPFSGVVSNLNAIDELKKQHYWSLAENKAFYSRLSRHNRQSVVNDVAHKWFYLHEHAKLSEVDLLSSEFIDHNLFKPFSEILNSIRLEEAAHSIRSRIWNES